MDFIVKKQPSCTTITIKECAWGPSPKDAVSRIYSPIRKAMIKYNGQAPTLIPMSPDKDTVVIDLIGGEGMDDSVIESAVFGLTKALHEFSESTLSLEDFIKEEKKQHGVEDVDIETIIPSKRWFKESQRRISYH